MRTFVNIEPLWTFWGNCSPAFPSSFLLSSFQSLSIDFLVKHHMLLIATKANQVPWFFFFFCFILFVFSLPTFQRNPKALLSERKHTIIITAILLVFPKWLTHDFGQKVQFFLFYKMSLKTMFQDVLHKKETFLDFQNISFKRGQESQFSKRVNPWFWSKISKLFFFFVLR